MKEIKKYAILFLYCLFFISTLSYAQQYDIWSVIIDKTKNKEQAIKIAKQVDNQFGIGIDERTLKEPPDQPISFGPCVSIYTLGIPNQFYISTYTGCELEQAEIGLKLTKQYYNKAELITFKMGESDPKNTYYSVFEYRDIIILGSFKNYFDAVKQSKMISKKTGFLYSTRGMIFDKNKGLIWPDDPDDYFAGRYAPRRYDKFILETKSRNIITIERSDFYFGFKKGFYIIVGGIYRNPKNAESELKVYKNIIPDAYIKPTALYMACIH